MSLAEKLNVIHENLDLALKDINSMLVRKNSEEANSINEVAKKISRIKTSSITPVDIAEGTITKVDLTGATNIVYYAFAFQTSITEVIIPETVKLINVGAFSCCTALENVKIYPGVTQIGNQAFDTCISLKNITIPDTVTRIWDRAFANCTSLTNIYIKSPIPFDIDSQVFPSNSNLKIYVPIGSREAYISESNWSNYADQIIEYEEGEE